MKVGARDVRVRALRELAHDAAARRAHGACVVEGPRCVADALATGVPIETALVSPRLSALPGGTALLERLARAVASAGAAGALLDVDDDILARACDSRTPQGVALVVPRPSTTSWPPVPPGRLLVAWEVQDPGNLGGLVRTAEASGCLGFIAARAVGGAAADPCSPRAIRASAGSAFRLPLLEWTGPPESLATELEARALRLVACVPRGGAPPEAADLTGTLALLVGGETRGLPDELERAATPVTVQLAGQVESLNAGVAAALVAFEAARQSRDTTPSPRDLP